MVSGGEETTQVGQMGELQRLEQEAKATADLWRQRA
eukprot:SAG11_NODE_6157_length_1374_cov_7.632941_1_plen_35_part_10